MRLCLNMIVRNEEALIADCIKSVLPYISCWAITDTGSSDNTPEIVRETLKNIPGCLTFRDFTNFGESRNYALDEPIHLYGFDYYLFMDADHQLVASDPEWHKSLSHDAYLLLQKSSDFSYRSVRLLRKGVKAHYIGATHEYLSVEGEVWALDEAFIFDSGRGSNRKDKLFRDRDLLERELRRAPSPRTLYYLAQTYRDLGNYKQAAQLYRQRAGMDDSEEAWRAQLEYSRCLLADKKDSKFIHQSLATYGRRPSRAEPLNDLARFFIDEGKHATALLFTELGMKISKPDKELEVVDDWIYDYGLREAYSAAAIRSNNSGLRICDDLSLSRNIPKAVRDGARNNLYYYCEPIDNLIKSWQSKQLTFNPPSGYSQMNCSVTNLNDRLLLMERTITYTVDGMGNYRTADNEHSRNFLLDIDPNTLNDMLMYEVHSPIDFPPPQNSRVSGWEDLRLFEWKGDLWTIGCVCEQNEGGMAEQYVARVNNHLDEWQRLIPMTTPVQHEKNWMPLSNGSLSYVYSCDPVRVLDWNANKVLVENETRIAADHFRGGSQLIAYGDGYLAIIHSVSRINNVSWYYHRFITFDHDINIDRISQPFIFMPGDQQRQGYQYAMGLCWHPDDSRLIVSYQTDECRSWLGMFEAADLSGFLRAV